MARLTIHVATKPVENSDQTRTVSKFRTTPINKIVFHNRDAAEELTVVIEGATDQDSPICTGWMTKTYIPTFTVGHGDRKQFKICDGDKWPEFKYTAQIGNTIKEDPIVIIEGWKARDSAALIALGGAIAGAVVYAVVQRVIQSRRPGPRREGSASA